MDIYLSSNKAELMWKHRLDGQYKTKEAIKALPKRTRKENTYGIEFGKLN